MQWRVKVSQGRAQNLHGHKIECASAMHCARAGSSFHPNCEVKVDQHAAGGAVWVPHDFVQEHVPVEYVMNFVHVPMASFNA
jgi:hypothetical protein